MIDSAKVVQERQQLTGIIAVAALPRLMESLHGSNGQLKYGISGDSDRRERPLLKLQVSGTVQLQCQRCLEGFEHELNIDTALRLVAADLLDAEFEAVGADPDEPDCIAASKTLDVAALIEDEVLLALPPYPAHPRNGQRDTELCRARSNDGNGIEDPDLGKKVTAFSALHVLKSQKSS